MPLFWRSWPLFRMFFGLWAMFVAGCQPYEADSPQTPHKAQLQIQLGMLNEPLVQPLKRLENLDTQVKTIVIDVRRLDGERLGIQEGLRVLDPQNEANQEISLLLDPGQVKVFAYAYSRVVFRTGQFSPQAERDQLLYFGSSEVLQLESGQKRSAVLEMKTLGQANPLEQVVVRREGSNYRFLFDLDRPGEGGTFTLFYGMSPERRFSQVFRLANDTHQELVLENPAIPPHVFNFLLSAPGSTPIVMAPMNCPLEVCGVAPPRLSIPAFRLANSQDFGEGLVMVSKHNRLHESVRGTLYLSEGPFNQTSLQAVRIKDAAGLLQAKVYTQSLPIFKPFQEIEFRLQAEQWAALKAPIPLPQMKSLHFVLVVESPSTQERGYVNSCFSTGANPLFTHSHSDYCSSAPYLQSLKPLPGNQGLKLIWGFLPFFGQEVTNAATRYNVSVEFYDPATGQLVKRVENQNATLSEPAGLLLYETQVDYAAQQLSTQASYAVRLNLQGQVSDMRLSRAEEKIPTGGGLSLAEAVSLEGMLNNGGGLTGINRGHDEYFSLYLDAEAELEVLILGLTPAGNPVFLTPQLLDQAGNAIAGNSSEIRYEFAAPRSGSYWLKLLQPKAEFTPLPYRLIVMKRDGTQASPTGVVMPAVAMASPAESPLLQPPSYDLAQVGLVRIPPGTYEQGGDPVSLDTPRRTVTISREFYIADHEVTLAEFRRFQPKAPPRLSCPQDDCPVSGIDWKGAQDYMQWLNQYAPAPNGLKYRFCREAEWEYAARAGSKARWSCGEDPACLREVAWYDYNSGRRPHPVRSLKPNAWGLYDMEGNQAEWVADFYGPYAEGPVTDPQGPATGGRLTLRGGSWVHNIAVLGVGFRQHLGNRIAPEYLPPLGIRVCASAP